MAKTYKPPVKESSFETVSNLAKVMVGKSSVKIHFKGEPEPFIVKKDNCPPEIRNGKWYLTVDEDRTKVLYVRPTVGQYKVRFKEFAKGNDDAEPSPKEVNRSFQKDGKAVEYSYKQFVALLEVVEGEAKGLLIPYYLRYHFADIDGVTGYDKPRSKYTDILREFLEIAGGWLRGELKYKENVLPAFEKRLQHANRQFFVVLKESDKGSVYIDTIYSILDDDEDFSTNEDFNTSDVVENTEPEKPKKMTGKQAVKELGFEDKEEGWTPEFDSEDEEEIEPPFDLDTDDENSEDELSEFEQNLKNNVGIERQA